MAIKRQTLEEIEIKSNGGEPKFTQLTEISKIEMSQALTWYTQNRDNKFAYKAISDYVKKHKIKASAEAINSQSTTFGYVCRMLERGIILNDKHQVWFDERLNNIKNYVSTKKEVDDEEVSTVNTVSIQDRINEKVAEIAGELEGSIDDFIKSGYTESKSAYAIMQDKVKGIHASKLLEIFKRRRAQFDEALNSDDEQVLESWDCYSKSQLKKLVSFCDNLIVDIMKFLQASAQSRKPRKRKQKSPEQLVAKMFYQKEYPPANLKSEDPKKIIGAQQLWVYNTKTKKLGVYIAEDAVGLSVKGSTILNFSESKSITKTLRKPDEVIPKVLTGGKVYLRNVWDDLTTKESVLTGRINTDTILLKLL